MVRSRAALKLQQSQLREKYIETRYIRPYAKPKYCSFKVLVEPWTAYCTVQYYIENCGIPTFEICISKVLYFSSCMINCDFLDLY